METNFNTELKRIRKLRGMTQEDLAEKVGVSAQAVSKWETASFPDAQALPQIADALGVTIDELYGRGKEEKSLNQQVMEAVRGAINYEDKDGKYYKGCMEKVTEFCRAFVLGVMGIAEYHPIEKDVWNAKTWETFSQGELESGFFQSRLQENLHYFLFMPEPEDGYDKILAYKEELVELFQFLGQPDALRALYFLAGQERSMFFNEKALACELGISEERGRKIIEKMLQLHFLWKADFNSGTGGEQIYQYRLGCNFIPFITFARILLHQPTGFQYQNSNRSHPYFINDTYKKKEKTNENERKEN